MTLVQLRQAIVQFVNSDYAAAYPSVPIVYDNNPFDWNNPPATFVEFEIEIQAGSQVGMSVTPETRVRGNLYVTVFTKTGTGVNTALGILDWFSQKLGYLVISPLQAGAPEPTGHREIQGWYTYGLKVSFYA